MNRLARRLGLARCLGMAHRPSHATVSEGSPSTMLMRAARRAVDGGHLPDMTRGRWRETFVASCLLRGEYFAAADGTGLQVWAPCPVCMTAGDSDGNKLPSSHPSDIRFLASLRSKASRDARARHEGEPSFGRYLAQVGVLGWTIVIPALLGMFLGRWIDHRLSSGIFWTAPLMLVGLAIGCWGAWRWMHRP